jgi:hypothetical protein
MLHQVLFLSINMEGGNARTGQRSQVLGLPAPGSLLGTRFLRPEADTADLMRVFASHTLPASSFFGDGPPPSKASMLQDVSARSCDLPLPVCAPAPGGVSV